MNIAAIAPFDKLMIHDKREALQNGFGFGIGSEFILFVGPRACARAAPGIRKHTLNTNTQGISAFFPTMHSP